MPTPRAASRLLRLKNGSNLRVDGLAGGGFRVRSGPGDCLHESGLNRYGILAPELAPLRLAAEPGGWRLETADAVLSVKAADGRLALRRKGAGAPALAGRARPAPGNEKGFVGEFRLKKGERLYGLGDVNRDCIQRRGRRYEMQIKNVIGYCPIPFLMSTAGWGLLTNTTWFHAVDAGAADPDRLAIEVPQGFPDFYLLAGDFPRGLLDRYTRLAGRPVLLPQWAYGLTFVCDERGFRALDMLNTAHEFRRQGIPCDGIGLEPGWMEKNYDMSVDKTWSQERFHIPFWLKGYTRSTFAAGLDKMGFKLSLWLCCDYDFSDYEERQLARRPAAGRLNTAASQASGAVIQDDRMKDALYLDKITKPGEPWFEHLKKFVDDGAQAFKLDACAQVTRHPDRKWANGMDDREIHNLNPLLYGKEMARGYTAHTGKRPMINIALGYAGIQQYAAMWAGDTGGGAKPLTSLLNHGCCGHSNVTTDMNVYEAAGIHFGFLQAWCQINSWHQYNEPWFQGKRLAAMFAEYARLRYRLMPYVYSMAALAARTGFPILRAMPLAFPDDPESDSLVLQYLFGDAFLTAAFAKRLHLPAGEWFDYWTGQRVKGPATVPVTFPENRGGPLYARAGALIPMAPPMDFWGERPLDSLAIEVFPGNRKEPFTLYEDDGLTEAYRRGAAATTEFNQSLDGGLLTLTVAPRKGRYAGMPARRHYAFEIHRPKPAAVRVNGKPTNDWHYDEEAGLLALAPLPAPTRRPLEIQAR